MTVRMRVRMMKLLVLPLFDSSASVTPCACVPTPASRAQGPSLQQGPPSGPPTPRGLTQVATFEFNQVISEPFLLANPAPPAAHQPARPLRSTPRLLHPPLPPQPNMLCRGPRVSPAKGPACHQNWGNLRREERLFTKIATKIMMAQPRSEGIKM